MATSDLQVLSDFFNGQLGLRIVAGNRARHLDVVMIFQDFIKEIGG